jgi:MoaA/NifB/PqqE/SkfB family radical SAM enzyme
MMSRRVSPVSIRVDGMRNGPPGFLSYDAFCRLLEQFPELEDLRLQGDGEPLAHPRFFDMVRLASRRGIEVSTISRLQVFNLRRAEECVRSGLRHLHVPLDAAGTREYDFSRSGARHERLLRHLRFLSEARKSRRSLWPRVCLTAVAMRRNLAGLAGVVKLAHAHGADSVAVQYLQHFVDVNGISPSHRRMLKFIESEALAAADAPDVERHFAEARAAAQELNVGLQLPAFPQKGLDNGGLCAWPWQGAYISFAGEAKPCSMAARNGALSFGNMLKDGVVRVWRSDAYREFRDGHLSGNPAPLCQACPRSNRPASPGSHETGRLTVDDAMQRRAG